MRHVIGFYSSERIQGLSPLEPRDRVIFRTDCYHSFGYFSFIAPAFEKYALRDAHIGIGSINVMFFLRSNDLDDALAMLDALEAELYKRPTSWREYLGEVQYPRQAKRPLQPMLFRYRAIRFVRKLQALVHKAQVEDKCLAYGNGVCYRHLCGIKGLPGTVYS
ncbi:hypothetical protein [Pseudomonas corrugata]|uniref:hypothetical protein n=1 Tax=Pseudomonas corrugata TaxID=47879 RepID=UPI0009C0E3FC|nr:hypothetical protein [Pseudomonas corrugata]